MEKVWFRPKRFGVGAAPCSWEGWTLTVLALLLAAAVILIGPGIRDNLLRTVFLVLGLAAVALPYGLIVRARTASGG